MDSIHKCREFLEYLKKYKLFEKESGPTNYLDKTRNIVTSVKFVLREAWPNSCSLASFIDTRLLGLMSVGCEKDGNLKQFLKICKNISTNVRQ